jgi:PKHD-type hydroxylase
MSYTYNGISNDTQSRKLLNPWMILDSAFSSAELTTIENHCKSLPLIAGGSPDSVGHTEEDEQKLRVSNVGFHYPNNPNLKFVFEKFNGIFEYVNSMFYNFDINGYDYFQYAEYDGKESGRYNWHMDLAFGESSRDVYSTRKLSMSMLLNTPEVDFEGGDFSTFMSKEINVPLKRGEILIFPSFIVHRVKPVTRGIRKSLVIWVTGPGFK